MKLIKRSRVRRRTQYYHRFSFATDPLRGFSFDARSDGRPVLHSREAAALYRRCVSGSVDGREVVDQGVSSYELEIHEPAVGRCDDCGGPVRLDRWTNICPRCGAGYDERGDALQERVI